MKVTLEFSGQEVAIALSPQSPSETQMCRIISENRFATIHTTYGEPLSLSGMGYLYGTDQRCIDKVRIVLHQTLPYQDHKEFSNAGEAKEPE